MSRVLGPLLSLDASKTFGRTLTFSKWKGINTVRLKSNPSNPQTTTQMTNRAYFSAGGKITKATDPSETEAVYIKTITPAQQSYASYLVSAVMGANYARITATKAFYNNVANATIKGYFDDAATQAGVQAVNIGSEAYEQLSAGLVLMSAYAGSNFLGSPNATVALASVSETNVFNYTEALTGILPT